MKSLGGLTFASTKMSAIMDMLGADASKYAVVTLVGRVWGYDITAFHFESRDYCEIVLEPELRVRIIDVAQSCGEQLFITAEVLDVSEGEDDGGGLILKAIAPPK